MTQENLFWGGKCPHMTAGVLEHFADIRLTSLPSNKPGTHRFDETVKLCPYCAGVLMAAIPRELTQFLKPNPTRGAT